MVIKIKKTTGMKQLFISLISIAISWNIGGQTLSTITTENVGDDMHYGADGYIYSSHYGGYHFRKINPHTGKIDTILTVGTNTIGTIDMDGEMNIITSSYELGWVGKFAEGDNAISQITAGLSGPSGLAVDSDGNIFAATNQIHAIVKISPDGTKETYVQGSPLFWPTGITIDTANNLFVTNMFSGQVIKVTPDKEMITLASLPAVADQMPDLAYLTWVPGALYVCHYGNHVVYKIDPENGDYQIVAGSGQSGGADGPALQAQLQNPVGIVAAPSGDTLYVSDGMTTNQRLRRLVLNGAPSAEISRPWLSDVRLFPSPAHEKITLAFDLINAAALDFQIVDALGKTHISMDGSRFSAGLHHQEVMVGGLQSGLWVLVVGNERFSKRLKFVKY